MELLLHNTKNFKKGEIANLHSNMELLLQTNNYYINLYTHKFTFQYGATSTQEKLVKIGYSTKFTFQYGATSTKPDFFTTLH